MLPTVAALLALAADPPAAPEGFTSLFNGTDLTGWVVYEGKKEKWKVEAGVIATGGGGGWLLSDRDYADYEMRLEYKLPEGGNSGVAVRAPLEGNPAFQGIEIQVIDDEWHEKNYKEFKDYQHNGSCYGVVPAAKKAQKPIGEWNRMAVIAKGRHLKVVINGETVVDADLDDHKEKHAKDHPGILRSAGRIGVQDHSEPGVQFRNIAVKELK